MPRLPRISIEGVLYYVTLRAPQGRNLFLDEEDYLTYLELLRKSRESNYFKLFAYVLMPGHLHLLMELGNGGNISEIMQSLNTSYTKYYNHRYQRKGHVFHGRFKATYVEKERHLCDLTRYIHLNPCELNLMGAPEDYCYSSCGAYANPQSRPLRGKAPNLKDEVQEILREFSAEDRREGYREFLMGTDEKQARQFHKALHRGGFLGSEEFVDGIRKQMEAPSGQRDEEVTDTTGSGLLWHRVVPIAASVIFLLGITGFYFYPENQVLKARFENYTAEITPEESLRNDTHDEYQMAMKERELELKQKEIELSRRETEMAAHLRVRRASLETQARRSLNGSVWTIRVTAESGKEPGESYEDRLRFENGRVKSDKLTSRGYKTSNCSIKVLPDGETAVWETMQRNESGEVVLWRGEWRGDKMTGVMAVRPHRGKTQTFNFSSESIEVAL